MSLSRQRVTMITLGVADPARAQAFYEAWGWKRHPIEEGLILFQLNGLALALFELDELAEDLQRPVERLGTGAMTLAQNCLSPAEVDTVFAAAMEAGAEALKQPASTFWGGYAGVFADPDGHVWEIAHNPHWPLAEDGSLTLSDTAGQEPPEGPSDR